MTRPEDPLLWTWIALVAAYAVVGVVLGVRERLCEAHGRVPLARPRTFG